jgi:hypothetical protein
VGHAVEITVFFVQPEFSAPWPDNHSVLAERVLKSGTRMLLLTSMRPVPHTVAEEVEQFIRNAILETSGSSEGVAAQLLWYRESGDALRTPFIFDLPVQIMGVEAA